MGKPWLVFAATYTIFVGRSHDLDAYDEFGSRNRIFAKRMQAVREAAEQFFIVRPSQNDEGALHDLVERAIALSIDRHRIAHGTLQGVHTFDPVEVGVYIAPVIKYFLGGPWYSVTLLKMNFLSMDHTSIDDAAVRFKELAADVLAYNEYLHSDP